MRTAKVVYVHKGIQIIEISYEYRDYVSYVKHFGILLAL